MYYVTLQWPSISEISCVRLHVVSTSSQRVQPVMKWDQYVGGARLSSGLQGADEKSDRSASLTRGICHRHVARI
jgi:hypothetical protein